MTGVDEAAVAVLEAPRQRPRQAVRWTIPTTAVALLTTASCLALWWVRHRGVVPGGDEPSYLDAAYAIGRLHTWSVADAVTSHFARSVGGGPTGFAQYVRNGADFPAHPIGFSAVLAIPLAFSATLASANVGLIVILSGLIAWACLEAARAVGAPDAWALVGAALFVTPAYLLATTQLYPDLLSGTLFALILVRLGRLEMGGPATTRSYAVTSLLLGVFAWVDDKNVIVVAGLALVLAYMVRGRGAAGREWAAAALPVALGILTLVAFNLYAYGRTLGPPQAVAPFALTMLTKFASLFVDRRHGLFVQCPVALLGVAGLATRLRRTPVTVTATVVGSFVVLAENASVAGGMNGGSFIGRYQWEILAILLVAAGPFVYQLWRARPRVAAVIGAVALILAVAEAEFVASSRPTAISFLANSWDPASYYGWWGRLDPSPVLNYVYHVWGNARNLWGVVAVVGLVAAALTALVGLAGSRARVPRAPTAALLVIAGAAWGLALTSPFTLPEPINYAASDLGPSPLPVPAHGVTFTDATPPGTVLDGPLLAVLPGRYSITIHYRLTDPHPGTVTATAELSAPGRTNVLAGATLASSRAWRAQSLVITVLQSGRLNLDVTWGGHGRLQVAKVVFAKTATCSVVDCRGGLA